MRTSLLSLAVLLSGCGPFFIAGNGNVTTSTREVGAFRKVEVSDNLRVRATRGPKQVTVKTDENLQSLVETVVEGDTLHVRLSPGTSVGLRGALEADVSNEALEGVEASGASHVTLAASAVDRFPLRASGSSTLVITDLTTTRVELDVSGSSDVTVSGAASTGHAIVDGASVVNLLGVPLGELGLEVAGSSTLRARVEGLVTGTVSGASTVALSGSPNNRLTTSGSATVTFGN